MNYQRCKVELLFILLTFGFKYSASSKVHFYSISEATSINNAVCPEDTLVYSCNILLSSAKGITFWLINMEQSSIPEKIFQLDQIGILGCANQKVVDPSCCTAVNVNSPTSTCINSNFTVNATADLNGKRVSCVNVGGANRIDEGSMDFYVAGTPEVTIHPSLYQLQISIISVPPQATHLVYAIAVFQGNTLISNETSTNGSKVFIYNLASNTEYTVIVSLENCPAVSPVNITTHTVAPAANVFVSYDESNIPEFLTWTDMGGFVQEYHIQLTTDTGLVYLYNTPRNPTSQNYSIPINLTCFYKYYILSVSSITDGIVGPSTTTFINGNNSTNLTRTCLLNFPLSICPNVSYNYTCSNTDLIPGKTVWRLPMGSCPSKNDSIILTRNAADNCSNISGTCGNFMAINNEPINGFCLTSILIAAVASNNAEITIQCFSDYDNSTKFEGEETMRVVSSPAYQGVSVQRNLTELQVTLNSVEESTTYAIEIVDVLRQENVTTAIFNNLSANTRYVINIIASNCAAETMNNISTCTLPLPPVDVKLDYLHAENDTYVIYWTRMDGCTIKYRVIITTDDGNVIADDNNVMSSSYLIRINETQNEKLYYIQVYSITEDALESPYSSKKILNLTTSVESKANCDSLNLSTQLSIAIAAIALFECCICVPVAFCFGLCLRRKKGKHLEVLNPQSVSRRQITQPTMTAEAADGFNTQYNAVN